MNTITSIIDYTSANIEAIIIIQQALCAALSAIFQLVGLTTASKVCGTIAALDLGRIIRRVKETKDAAKKAGLVAVVALLAACSAAPAGSSDTVSAAQASRVAVAAVAATDIALAAAIDRLPPGTDLAPWEDRVEQLEEAAELVRKAEATAEDVCQSARIAAPVAEVLDCSECITAIETIASVACGGDK